MKYEPLDTSVKIERSGSHSRIASPSPSPGYWSPSPHTSEPEDAAPPAREAVKTDLVQLRRPISLHPAQISQPFHSRIAALPASSTTCGTRPSEKMQADQRSNDQQATEDASSTTCGTGPSDKIQANGRSNDQRTTEDLENAAYERLMAASAVKKKNAAEKRKEANAAKKRPAAAVADERTEARNVQKKPAAAVADDLAEARNVQKNPASAVPTDLQHTTADEDTLPQPCEIARKPAAAGNGVPGKRQEIDRIARKPLCKLTGKQRLASQEGKFTVPMPLLYTGNKHAWKSRHHHRAVKEASDDMKRMPDIGIDPKLEGKLAYAAASMCWDEFHDAEDMD